LNRNYSLFITSQYQNSTKFLEWINVLIAKMQDVDSVADYMDLAFDVDVAIGPQLDTLGVIIGISRNITIPLEGLFFSWDDGSSPPNLELGWEMGSWRDPNEGSEWTTMTILPDDAYRQILKFKIIQNSWEGTVDELYRAWETIFAGQGLVLKIIDNQDMTADMTVTGPLIPVTIQYVLTGNSLLFKPAGVGMSYTFNEI